MVRCTGCGVENKEDAKFCIQCGTNLHKTRNLYRMERDVCFGPLPHLMRFLSLVFGLLLISWGITSLLDFYGIRFVIWPWVIIAIGLYVIYRILSGTKPPQNES